MGREETLQIINEEPAQAVIRDVARLWAESTTDRSLARRDDLLQDKTKAVRSFFAFCRKMPAEVATSDVKEWQADLEERGLKASTVYTRTSFLSSFYRWAMANSSLGQHITVNPVALARPKKPKPYRTDRTKSLLDDQVRALVSYVREKAAGPEGIVAKRDYALVQWYIKTGRRRHEVISLRGSDMQLRKFTAGGWTEEVLIVRYRIKVGRYLVTELRDPIVRGALLGYLDLCGRRDVIGTLSGPYGPGTTERACRARL